MQDKRMLNEGERAFLSRLLASDAELGPMFKVFLRSIGHAEAIRPQDGLRSAHRSARSCPAAA